MTRTPLRDIAWLVRNGPRLSEIENFDDAEILAWGVAFGEARGGEWDWREMKWREPDKG